MRNATTLKVVTTEIDKTTELNLGCQSGCTQRGDVSPQNTGGEGPDRSKGRWLQQIQRAIGQCFSEHPTSTLTKLDRIMVRPSSIHQKERAEPNPVRFTRSSRDPWSQTATRPWVCAKAPHITVIGMTPTPACLLDHGK